MAATTSHSEERLATAALLRRLNDDVMTALTAARACRDRTPCDLQRAHWDAVHALLQAALPHEPLPTVTVRLLLELRAYAIAQTLAA